MQQVNIHSAKTHLSALVESAANGESFIIAKAGRPMVTVVPYELPAQKPRVGFLKDTITIPDDFNCMGDDLIADMFEGQS